MPFLDFFISQYLDLPFFIGFDKRHILRYSNTESLLDHMVETASIVIIELALLPWTQTSLV